MAITSDSFENPPPSSLDAGANERVRRSIARRKRRRELAENQPTVEEQVQRSKELEEKASQFENAPPSSLDAGANQRIKEGKRIATINQLSAQAESQGEAVVQRGSQRVRLVGPQRKPTVKTVTPTTTTKKLETEKLTVQTGRQRFKQELRESAITTLKRSRDQREDRRRNLREDIDFDKIDRIYTIGDKGLEFSASGFATDIITKNPSKSILRIPVVRKELGEGFSETVKGFINLVPALAETSENIGATAVVYTLFPEERDNLKALSKEGFGQSKEVLTDPSTYVSVALGSSATGKGTLFIERARDLTIKYNPKTKSVPAKNIFNDESLKVEEFNNKFGFEDVYFPPASSIEKLQKDFGSGRPTKVVSASPKPLSRTDGDIVIGEGPAGRRNLEDTGLYVTPEGEGSAYFLGLRKTSERYTPQIQLFPRPSRPTVTVIDVPGVQRLPKNILESNNQLIINTFERTNPGKVFITSNVERNFNPRLRGRRTSEAEGEITPGSNVGTLPLTKYTEVGGRVVPVDEGFLRSNLRNGVDDVTVPSSVKSSNRQSTTDYLDSDIGISPGGASSFRGSSSQQITTSNLRDLQVTRNSLSSNTQGNILGVSGSPTSSLNSEFAPPTRPGAYSSPTRTLEPERIIRSPYIERSDTPFRRGGGGRTPPPPPTRTNIITRPPERTITRDNNRYSYRKPSIRGRAYSPQITNQFLRVPRLKPTQKRSSSFTTQVFKKGKFVTVGRRTTKEDAFTLGSRTVGGSALRTFRVLRGSRPVNIQGKRFRRSKSQPFAIVERSRYAINTPGEVFSIPGASKKKKRRTKR